VSLLLSHLILELVSALIFLFAVRVDDLMKSVYLVLLGGEHFCGLTLAHVEVTELRLQFGLGCIVLVLHGEDVLVDGDLILQEVVQLVDSLPLQDLLIFQQLQLVFQVLDLLLQSLNKP
jgi:hypothetical protein